MKYSTGPDWFTLSNELVEYVVNHQNESPLKEFLNIFNYTILSAERFFLAVLKNSHFCTTHVDSALRKISWQQERNGFRGLGCHTQRPSVDWFGGENSPYQGRGCSPIAYSMSQWDEIRKDIAEPKFFLIRKFDATIDMSILNKIDEQLFGIHMPTKYWQNIWHHK